MSVNSSASLSTVLLFLTHQAQSAAPSKVINILGFDAGRVPHTLRLLAAVYAHPRHPAVQRVQARSGLFSVGRAGFGQLGSSFGLLGSSLCLADSGLYIC
jgi:hypothetical protein